MKVIPFRSLVLFAFMIMASALAITMKPAHKAVASGLGFDLERVVPKEFADWRYDDTIAPIQPDPETEAMLKKIYSQTLSRTYVNPKGERVMLSIAYGGDQSESMQVHKPEVCYPAQGFQLLELTFDHVVTDYGVIPVKKLVAKMGLRNEPITYWVTIGDTVAVNSVKWKLTRLKYGLTGEVPDGLLFRVSSIGGRAEAYPLQENFIKSLLSSLTPENRKRLIGNTL